jgi:hypothetical protein
MMEIGRMINNMVTERKRGLIKLFIKEIISMEKNMERAHFYGKMIAAMRVNLLRTIFKVLVNTFGKMGGPMKENGKITKWMEREFLHGLMEEDTKGSTRTTRRRVLEFFTLEMVEFTKVNGKMVDSMVKVYSVRKT